MRIAVIGNGKIGATLAAALGDAGHQITVGVRDPRSAQLPEHAATVRVASVAEALEGAEAVILAVPARALDDVLAEHARILDGLLVVDATNDIAGPGPAHARAKVARAAPRARYVRAFNSLGWENLVDPVVGGEQADMFFSCAESDREAAEGLIGDVGLRPMWVGADAEDVVDGVLRLWFALSRTLGRRLAFRVLTDESG
jgi:predicted dinucleotide-binding enzyme